MFSKFIAQISKKEESNFPLFLEKFGCLKLIIKIFYRVFVVKKKVAVLIKTMKNIHLI